MIHVLVIEQDGGDPDFLRNLAKLGQVKVPKPGTPFEQVRLLVVFVSIRMLIGFGLCYVASTGSAYSTITDTGLHIFFCSHSTKSLPGW